MGARRHSCVPSVANVQSPSGESVTPSGMPSDYVFISVLLSLSPKMGQWFFAQACEGGRRTRAPSQFGSVPCNRRQPVEFSAGVNSLSEESEESEESEDSEDSEESEESEESLDQLARRTEPGKVAQGNFFPRRMAGKSDNFKFQRAGRK